MNGYYHILNNCALLITLCNVLMIFMTQVMGLYEVITGDLNRNLFV